MRKRAVPRAIIPAAAAALLALAAALGACVGAEEVTAPVATATPVATPAVTATPVVQATPAASSPAATAAPSLPAIPENWQAYADPVLGFSLRYPPDLILTDLTGPSPAGGLKERVLLVRSAQDQARVFSISIIESNPRGLTVDEWAVEYAACNPKSIEPGVIGEMPAILCSREAVEDRAEPAVLADVSGRIFMITSGSALTGDEFSGVIKSFRF